MSKFTTKVTNINGVFCCRVFYSDTPVVEARVKSREEIGSAFRDLLRTLDKCGGDEFTHAARVRTYKDNRITEHVKHHWL